MLIIAKIISMFGLSSYMTIAVINNTIDKSTNEFFLSLMMRMELLKGDHLGQGIIHRAIKSTVFPKLLLKVIVFLQSLIAVGLWFSSIQLASFLFFHNLSLEYIIQCSSIAVSIFMGLWFFFWCGGFWFGYWIKMGQVQEVHMKLIIISLLELLLLNFNG
jgi:predicted small integral membrane protein